MYVHAFVEVSWVYIHAFKHAVLVTSYLCFTADLPRG